MFEQLVKEVISDISQREDRQRNRRDDAQQHFEYAVRYLLTDLWKASKSIPFRESKINRNRNYYSSQPERYRDSNLTHRQVIAAFEGLFVEKTKNTASTMRQSFPNAEIMLRIKTTPTSVVAISVYPRQEKADEARAELDKRMADYGDAVKDHWFLEGEVISAHINEEWVKNSIKR